MIRFFYELNPVTQHNYFFNGLGAFADKRFILLRMMD